jgi:DNA-binding HxlR family transcriptional regulator
MQLMCYNGFMNEKTTIEIDRKSYGQVCPVSTALDYIGDRWTILILRELLGGSARFQELRDGLPGIATNLLTERLRRLEADGIVRQINVHNTVLYALTEHGAGLRHIIEELGFWGARMGRAAPAKHERSIRAFAMALQAILARAGDSLPQERLIVELEVEGDYLEFVLDAQRPTVTARLSTDPDARAYISKSGLATVLGEPSFDEGLFSHVSGDEAVTKQLVAVLK